MPARDLTKKEKTLFYINVGLVAFAFIFARISFGNVVFLFIYYSRTLSWEVLLFPFMEGIHFVAIVT